MAYKFIKSQTPTKVYDVLFSLELDKYNMKKLD